MTAAAQAAAKLHRRRRRRILAGLPILPDNDPRTTGELVDEVIERYADKWPWKARHTRAAHRAYLGAVTNGNPAAESMGWALRRGCLIGLGAAPGVVAVQHPPADGEGCELCAADLAPGGTA